MKNLTIGKPGVRSGAAAHASVKWHAIAFMNPNQTVRSIPVGRKSMKLAFAIMGLCAGLAVAAGTDQPTLNPISGEATLASRIDFIERYFEIQRADWQLALPTGYSATVAFRQRGAEKPMLEFSLDQGTTTPLYFATAPDGAERIQVTFGNLRQSVSVYLPKPKDAWLTKFGQLEGSEKVNLFEILLPADASSWPGPDS
jgi:hypothetical protein